MNLSNLKAKNTIDVQLKHPVTGENIEGGIVVCYAPHTAQYRKAALTVASQAKKNITADIKDLSTEEIGDLIKSTDSAGVDILEMIILDHDFRLNGEKVANIRDILGDSAYFWINQQIQAELNKEQVFMEA